MTETTDRIEPPAIEPSETRRIIALAAPLTAAYAAEMGMVITDMIIVGRLGSDELAAVGLTGDLFWILLLMGMGVIAMVGLGVPQQAVPIRVPDAHSSAIVRGGDPVALF